MRTRKTRKEKATPNYQFILRTNQVSLSNQNEYFKDNVTKNIQKEEEKGLEVDTTKLIEEKNITLIKKSILKSLIFTTLILVLELVLFIVLR